MINLYVFKSKWAVFILVFLFSTLQIFSHTTVKADHFTSEITLCYSRTAVDHGFAEREVNNTEELIVSSVTKFLAAGETQEVTVTANLAWTVNETESWISVTPLIGTGNDSFTITVLENVDFYERTATITVSGGDLTRYIEVTQNALIPSNLINDGTTNDSVTVNASTEQVDGVTYFNYAKHSLDKNFNTRWSGQGIGVELIYDLGNTYDLELINIATFENKVYLYDIWTSTNGVDYNFVSNNQDNRSGVYESNVITSQARYLKIIGNGQPTGSNWNSYSEIEIFGDLATLTINDFEFNKSVNIYPIPTNDNLNVKILTDKVKTLKLYSIKGQLILERTVNTSNLDFSINLESVANGTYILNFSGENGLNVSKQIIVSH